MDGFDIEQIIGSIWLMIFGVVESIFIFSKDDKDFVWKFCKRFFSRIQNWQKGNGIKGKTFRWTDSRRISIAIPNSITVIVNNFSLFGNIFRCFFWCLKITSIQCFIKSYEEKKIRNFNLIWMGNGNMVHWCNMDCWILTKNRMFVQFFAYSFFFLLKLRITLLWKFGCRVGGYVSGMWTNKHKKIWFKLRRIDRKKSRICDIFRFEFNLQNKIFKSINLNNDIIVIVSILNFQCKIILETWYSDNLIH